MVGSDPEPTLAKRTRGSAPAACAVGLSYQRHPPPRAAWIRTLASWGTWDRDNGSAPSGRGLKPDDSCDDRRPPLTRRRLASRLGTLLTVLPAQL